MVAFDESSVRGGQEGEDVDYPFSSHVDYLEHCVCIIVIEGQKLSALLGSSDLLHEITCEPLARASGKFSFDIQPDSLAMVNDPYGA